MLQKAEEITRLFRERKPDIALLDEFEKMLRWPAPEQAVLHGESGGRDHAQPLQYGQSSGCGWNARLVSAAIGFKHASEARAWKTLRSKAAQHVLFSKFVLDLPAGVPGSLNDFPCAADHGHVMLMLPEIPAGDVVQAPPGAWIVNKRRCLLGAGFSRGAGREDS